MAGKPSSLKFAKPKLRGREHDQAVQLLAAIVESSDDAIMSETLDGVVLSWNSGAERVYGYAASEAVGRHISFLFPPSRISESGELLAKVRRGKRIEHFETVRIRKDGQSIDVSLTISPLRNAANDIVGASIIARDMTERSAADKDMRRLLQETLVLNHVIAAASVPSNTSDSPTPSLQMAPSAMTPKPNAMLTIMCEELAHILHLPQAMAALLDDAHTQLVVTTELRNNDRPTALGQIIRLENNAAVQQVLEQREPLVVPDAQYDPSLAPMHALAQTRGTVSLLIVPLTIRSEAIGILMLEDVGHRIFTEPELDLAQRVATAAGPMLENARLVAALQNELHERRRVEQALRFQAKLLDAVGQAVMATDLEGNITYWNRFAAGLYGWSAEEMIGKNMRILLPQEAAKRMGLALIQHLSAGESWSGELVVQRKNGTTFPAIITHTPVHDETGKIAGTISISFDNTERHKTEAQLRQISTHDPLTGLFNRVYFEAEQARLVVGRKFPVSIILIDVNDLKTINDHWGHAVGDKLLEHTAAILKSAFRAEDVVARIGGDEFAILLPNTNSAAATEGVNRIKSNLATYNLTASDIQISFSMGIATAEDGAALAETLKQADDRMYQEKLFRKTL